MSYEVAKRLADEVLDQLRPEIGWYAILGPNDLGVPEGTALRVVGQGITTDGLEWEDGRMPIGWGFLKGPWVRLTHPAGASRGSYAVDPTTDVRDWLVPCSHLRAPSFSGLTDLLERAIINQGGVDALPDIENDDY